jgi:soluble P-type ATPase
VIEVDVPGWKQLRLSNLLLDVNGTLSLDGDVLPVVSRRLHHLRSRLQIHLLSADTHGRLEATARELNVPYTRVDGDSPGGPQKAAFLRLLGPEAVVAIGNGSNDGDMLREAALGIVVLGHEGASRSALLAGDLLTGSVHEALDLLLHPARLVATLRS